MRRPFRRTSSEIDDIQSCYVLDWKIYLALADHAFMNDYVINTIAAREAEGLSGDALTAFIADMELMN